MFVFLEEDDFFLDFFYCMSVWSLCMCLPKQYSTISECRYFNSTIENIKQIEAQLYSNFPLIQTVELWFSTQHTFIELSEILLCKKPYLVVFVFIQLHYIFPCVNLQLKMTQFDLIIIKFDSKCQTSSEGAVSCPFPVGLQQE